MVPKVAGTTHTVVHNGVVWIFGCQSPNTSSMRWIKIAFLSHALPAAVRSQILHPSLLDMFGFRFGQGIFPCPNGWPFFIDLPFFCTCTVVQ
jgi:hypothetical protein